jgi:hypothetical protein
MLAATLPHFLRPRNIVCKTGYFACFVKQGDIPEQLRRLQFVRFDSGAGITRPLGQLAEALRRDLEWRGDNLDAAKAGPTFRLGKPPWTARMSSFKRRTIPSFSPI